MSHSHIGLLHDHATKLGWMLRLILQFRCIELLLGARLICDIQLALIQVLLSKSLTLLIPLLQRGGSTLSIHSGRLEFLNEFWLVYLLLEAIDEGLMVATLLRVTCYHRELCQARLDLFLGIHGVP